MPINLLLELFGRVINFRLCVKFTRKKSGIKMLFVKNVWKTGGKSVLMLAGLTTFGLFEQPETFA